MSTYTPIANRPRTYFVDIDGVIFKQENRWPDMETIDPKRDLLPGVRETFLRWEASGCKIVLTTGRADNFRELTERQLREAGIPYHHLIMSAGMGQRVLINNLKPQEPSVRTALAINLPLDVGMSHMNEEGE
ncbi:peptidyl-tRNA hydrolase [candidate division KSB1 bacterium]|nr:peptidyl-tRNA hydrolase [candidate division KSB1 bacterium]